MIRSLPISNLTAVILLCVCSIFLNIFVKVELNSTISWVGCLLLDSELFILGTIHLRRRQIFMIFDTYPPSIGIPAKCLWRGFFILMYCELLTIGTRGHPSPPKTFWRLKWMVPKLTVYNIVQTATKFSWHILTPVMKFVALLSRKTNIFAANFFSVISLIDIQNFYFHSFIPTINVRHSNVV